MGKYLNVVRMTNKDNFIPEVDTTSTYPCGMSNKGNFFPEVDATATSPCDDSPHYPSRLQCAEFDHDAIEE